jgi:nitrite reductase/ring-hydroxylating ferredoxin subunit
MSTTIDRLEPGPGVLGGETHPAPAFDWPAEDNRIPREAYLDEALYEQEMRRLFGGPYWILVGHAAEIPDPGDYKTAHVGDVPLIIVRDLEGQVHALVNSCAHRGTALVRESHGNLAARKCLTCIYHNWRYDLTGRLISAALKEDFPEDFVREDYGLVAARLESYRGALFVSLSDDAPPLRDYLGGTAAGLDLALGDGDLIYLGSQKVIYTLSVRLAIPRGVSQTEMQFLVFARRGESEELMHHRVRQASNLFGPEGFISLEDQTALARVHDGAPGRGDNVVLKGTLKRFPPYRILDEAGIRHFYDSYRRALGFGSDRPTGPAE